MATANRQSLDQNLFFLGGLITLILTISAILNLSNSNNFLTLALFLPIPIYFLYLFYQRLHKYFRNLFNIDQTPQRFFGNFSIREFFSQTDWDFLVTLILFSLSLALIMYKISQELLK